MRQTACRVRSTSLLDRPERFVRLWSGFEATLAVHVRLNCYTHSSCFASVPQSGKFPGWGMLVVRPVSSYIARVGVKFAIPIRRGYVSSW